MIHLGVDECTLDTAGHFHLFSIRIASVLYNHMHAISLIMLLNTRCSVHCSFVSQTDSLQN